MTPAATSALAAGSLVAGYAVAASTGVRGFGGLVLLAGEDARRRARHPADREAP